MLTKVNLPRKLIVPENSRKLQAMVAHHLMVGLSRTLRGMPAFESKLGHEVLQALTEDLHLRGYSMSRIDDATVGPGKVIRTLVEAASLKPEYLPGLSLLPATYALVEATQKD